ncbi:hypothetical protein MBLNU230_g1225t1 [Neophaeotheca triangularis]
MSSPYRRHDRSTPHRSSPATHRRTQPNGYHESPSRNYTESPSERLAQELTHLLIDSDKAFASQLDAQAKEQEVLHRKALEDARAKHEAVRRGAEEAHERYLLAIAQEKAKREEEERVALLEARRQAHDRELAKKQLEVQQVKEEEEARKRLAEEESNLQREKQRSEENKQREAKAASERKSKDAQAETERRAREEAEAREKEKQAQQANPHPSIERIPGNAGTTVAQTQTAQSTQQSSQQPPQAMPQPAQSVDTASAKLVSSKTDRDATHQRYLDLHQRLKGLRTDTNAQCKTMPQLKDQKGQFLLSDWRRSIAQACGTLAKGTPQANSKAMRKTVDILENAAKYEGPMIDMSSIIISADQPVEGQGSAILVFLLNHFAKTIVRRMIEEASRDHEMAEPLGIMVVTVFARPTLAFQGHSLIDLLWAKYHRVCPMLFGVWGDERTEGGRKRLGWWKENNKYITAERHYDRMSGLAIGFAAISLRNFSKMRTQNPAPNRIYWESLARLTNTPSNELQPSHFHVVRSMLRQHVPRFLQLYGKAGLAAVKHALFTLPQRGKAQGIDASGILDAQAAVLRQELHLPF